ncbi:VG15 protein [Streptomyces chartreusis]|uniref:VG15 protein n=1 Tax=Streptomyces chartreusis TaxID=1969 RepID=UPI0037FFFFED
MADPLVRSIALAQYRRQQLLVRQATARVQALWQRIDRGDISGSWEQLSPLLVAAVTDAQTQAAGLADSYLDDILAAEGADPAAAGRIVPSAFAGIASDGRPLLSLLYQPVIDWKVRMLAGQSMEDAFRGSLASALRITATQVADAGRGATGAAMAGRRTIQGYVRVVQPPACGRCVILAGKEFGWNKGFQRHPRCDCIHLPTTLIARSQHRGRIGADRFAPTTRPGSGAAGFIDPRAYFNGLSRAEQDRVFGADGARAIRDGADMAQVVNARRGMTTMSAYGRQVLATREATTRRGAFYRLERARTQERTGTRFARDRTDVRRGLPRFELRTPRLMPEEIYRLAESRDEALAMLRRFGYLT